MEGSRIEVDQFLLTARKLFSTAAPHRKVIFFLATTSPAAVSAARNMTGDDEVLVVSPALPVDDVKAATQSNYWLEESSLPEANFLDAVADISDILDAAGAVVTFSSNMGRFVWMMRRSDFLIESLDTCKVACWGFPRHHHPTAPYH